jgi:hypothetical protein
VRQQREQAAPRARTARIVARQEVLRAPPVLTDYHLAPDEVTVELPKDESWFENVKLDARDRDVVCPLAAAVRR